LSGYRDQPAVSLATRFRERLRGVAGVESVGHARMIPLQGSGFGFGSVRIAGAESRLPEGRIDSDWDVVSPDYFETIGINIVAGRGFRDSDRENTAWVAVVSETFAKQAWPGQSAVGRTFFQRLSETDEREVQIVGIARDTKYRFISTPPAPFIFVPMAQNPLSFLNFYIRHTPGRPIEREIRAAMAQVEPSVPIVQLQSFDNAAAVGLLPQQLSAWIAGTVGTIGILLAALGLYGLMAFLVAQRTREIAIRMALGATDRAVRLMVLKQASVLAAIGGMVGVVLAGVIATLARSLLVGVAPIDPAAFGGTALLFAAVLALAAWAPASRAATTDPATALRSE
jgi:predicted permease